MDFRLADRTALVFGGSKGLGRAIAEALIAEGMRVAIVARNPARTREVADQIGAAALPGDLSRPGAGADIVRLAARELGEWPDVLVTNTGGPTQGPFESTGSQQWQSAFESLLLSTVESIREVLPHMRRKNWGRIIAVASLAAKEPHPGLMLSNCLRAGLLGLVNGLSREVARDGITINALLPGFIRTDRLTDLGIDELEVGQKIPAGRLGKPSEFAAVAAFLASDQATYLTGQAIAIDGGLMHGI